MYTTDYPALTPLQLAEAGEALFGRGWRAALAHAFGVTETDIVTVEAGQVAAPAEWRAKLVAVAQDIALRAMDTAGSLLWFEDESGVDASAPPPAEIARLV